MGNQLLLALITHEVENAIIPQRAVDGYVDATAMCAACGKNFFDYKRLSSTTDFLDELYAETGIPVSELVVTKKGGNVAERGTWVHPDVAINLGQWCSPKFAVAVSKWVRKWMAGKFASAKMPYHVQRYMVNMPKVPHTHFSMLNELTFNLIGPLELQGYTLPDNMVPDISEGKMFSQWLRDEKGVEPSEFLTYSHHYADGRVVQARLYPISLLEDFRKHFHGVWIPKRMMNYFKERDPKALQHFPAAFPALFGTLDTKRLSP
ncbi:MAG: KilA-N domain-containing protein [Planctomycetaceae bacterium]|nr:KilA-N domain-containing protein [Planctomycetaceae bacterium]